jgi:hypothetical protein
VISGSISARAEDTKRACIAASTLGQTLRDEGKLVDAREPLLRCSREDCPGVVKAYCAEWLAEIETQTPSLVVRATDAAGNDRTDVKTSIDGRVVKLDGKPIPLDPGEHVVSVETPEGWRRDQKVLIVVREKSRLLTIQVAPKGPAEPGPSPAPTEKPVATPVAGGETPTPAPATQGGIPAGAFVVGGVGVAALGSALYFGLTARSEYDTLKHDCSPKCTPDQSEAAHRKAVIADVSLGVGVAAIAGGVLWAVIAPKKEPRARTAMIVAPSADGFVATVDGTF